MGNKASKNLSEFSLIDNLVPTAAIEKSYKFWKKHCLSKTAANEMVNQRLLDCLTTPFESEEASSMIDDLDILKSIGDILQWLHDASKSSAANEQLWAMIYQFRAICKEFNLDETTLIQVWRQFSHILLKRFYFSLSVQHSLDVCALYCISLLCPAYGDDNVATPISRYSTSRVATNSYSNLSYGNCTPVSAMSVSNSESNTYLSQIRYPTISSAEACLAHPFMGNYLCRWLESDKIKQNAFVSFFRDYRIYRDTNAHSKVVLGERLIAEYLYTTSWKSLVRRKVLSQDQANQILNGWDTIVNVSGGGKGSNKSEMMGLFEPMYRSILAFIDRDLISDFERLLSV